MLGHSEERMRDRLRRPQGFHDCSGREPGALVRRAASPQQKHERCLRPDPRHPDRATQPMWRTTMIRFFSLVVLAATLLFPAFAKGDDGAAVYKAKCAS